MAITKTWEINTCKRDIADGFIKEIIFRLKAMDGETEVEGTRQPGSVHFEKPSKLPSEFIAFDTSKKTPTADTMITWVKESLGTSQVTAMETAMDNAVTLIQTPVEATGTPF